MFINRVAKSGTGLVYGWSHEACTSESAAAACKHPLVQKPPLRGGTAGNCRQTTQDVSHNCVATDYATGTGSTSHGNLTAPKPATAVTAQGVWRLIRH